MVGIRMVFMMIWFRFMFMIFFFIIIYVVVKGFGLMRGWYMWVNICFVVSCRGCG